MCDYNANQADIQHVIDRLDHINKGANVHTINKARLYLTSTDMLTISRERRLILLGLVTKAIKSNEWYEVRKHLIDLF